MPFLKETFLVVLYSQLQLCPGHSLTTIYVFLVKKEHNQSLISSFLGLDLTSGKLNRLELQNTAAAIFKALSSGNVIRETSH